VRRRIEIGLSMRLDKPSLINKTAKVVAKPLSSVVCSSFLQGTFRAVDAYLNFLLGKGAGAGWDRQEEVRAATTRISRPHPVVFDVGANVGKWTQGLLHALPGARVFMVEPSPGCQAAIQAKNLPGTTLIPCAVGESAGQASFHFSSATDGSASLHVREDTPFRELNYQRINVQIRTLDEILDTLGVDFVDFMKMDIEGHELFALHGAKRALAARRIGALSFEFGCGNVNSRTYFRDFWDLLKGAGFEIWRIAPGGKEVRIGEYYEDLEYFRGATNYVAALSR
jgi:FkbM family methyltransferase